MNGRSLALAAVVWLAMCPAGRAQSSEPALPTNPEGVWMMAAHGSQALCSAMAQVDETLVFSVAGAEGGAFLGFTRLDGVAFPRGPAVIVETDAGRFEYEPSYRGDTTILATHTLSADALGVLRRAKDVKAVIAGQTIADMALGDTGFSKVLDEVVACSRGEAGWWGQGAPQPAS